MPLVLLSFLQAVLELRVSVSSLFAELFPVCFEADQLVLESGLLLPRLDRKQQRFSLSYDHLIGATVLVETLLELLLFLNLAL